jgi:hypothetical protein
LQHTGAALLQHSYVPRAAACPHPPSSPPWRTSWRSPSPFIKSPVPDRGRDHYRDRGCQALLMGIPDPRPRSPVGPRRCPSHKRRAGPNASLATFATRAARRAQAAGYTSLCCSPCDGCRCSLASTGYTRRKAPRPPAPRPPAPRPRAPSPSLNAPRPRRQAASALHGHINRASHFSKPAGDRPNLSSAAAGPAIGAARRPAATLAGPAGGGV